MLVTNLRKQIAGTNQICYKLNDDIIGTNDKASIVTIHKEYSMICRVCIRANKFQNGTTVNLTYHLGAYSKDPNCGICTFIIFTTKILPAICN